jgi:hypothetical protein
MRLRRAGHVVTRPLNCGVVRLRTVIIGGAVAALGGVAISLSLKAKRESLEVAVVPAPAPFAAEVQRSPPDAAPPAGDNWPSDVREMSQSFRHTSFLIAVRRAGFSCDDVVAAHESAAGVWLASCRDLGGYKISVDGIDTFHVEPIAHNVDAAF